MTQMADGLVNDVLRVSRVSDHLEKFAEFFEDA